MDGGPDPDCRRGMLWDKTRQNQNMLAWYQRLILLRHQEPVLTEGELVCQHAEDSKGLLVMKRRLDGKSATLIFHIKGGTISLPDFQGQTELISGRAFSGVLGEYEAAVLANDKTEG